MKKEFVIGIVSMGVFSFSGFGLTQAWYLDSAHSMQNNFTASLQFPTSVPSPTPSEGASHVVISEMQITGGSGLAEQDFIELYNPTSSPIDLQGYRLVKRTQTGTADTDIVIWTSSTVIPAYGFYLWANSGNGFAASIGANSATTDTISSNNSIAIRSGAKDTGTIVDAVAWGSGHTSALGEGTAFTSNPVGGQSMERKANALSDSISMSSGVDVHKGNGYDSNSNATDFILRAVSLPQNTSNTEIP